MRQRREINIFNLSFLDVLSCGLGAVVVLLILGFMNAQDFAARQNDVAKARAKVDEARKGWEKKQKVTQELKDLIAELRRDGTSSAEKIQGLQDQLDRLQWIQFAGIRVQKKRVLLLMDLSGSMYDEDTNYARSADKLIAIAQALVQQLPDEGFQFTIRGFWGLAPQDEQPAFEPGLVPASAANRQRAETWIKATVEAYGRKRGGTPTWEALEKARNLPGLGAIVLITDGAPNTCMVKDEKLDRFVPVPALFDRFRAEVRALRLPVEIHCIGVGKQLYEDPVFRRFLVGLAADSGGGFAAF